MNLCFQCISSLHKTIISVTTIFHISIFLDSYLMLWWSLDIIQIKFMLLSFSCFYLLVFWCTNDFRIIFIVKFSFFFLKFSRLLDIRASSNLLLIFSLIISYLCWWFNFLQNLWYCERILKNCFYWHLYLKIVLENMIAVYPYILNIPLEHSSQPLEDLQTLTVLKYYQQYSTIAYPKYGN